MCQEHRCVCAVLLTKVTLEETRMKTNPVASGRRAWGAGDGKAAFCVFGASEYPAASGHTDQYFDKSVKLMLFKRLDLEHQVNEHPNRNVPTLILEKVMSQGLGLPLHRP